MSRMLRVGSVTELPEAVRKRIKARTEPEEQMEEKPKENQVGRPTGSEKSNLEEKFDRLMREAGVRPAETEYEGLIFGRKWRYDRAWPDQKVAVEIHGGTYSGGRHVRGRGFSTDREKMNSAQLVGWTVLEFTKEHLNEGMCVPMVKRALGMI